MKQKANKSSNRSKNLLRAALFALCTTMVSVSEAALLNLADSPLYLITTVDPNVVLTFDDSGSMAWFYIPDGVSGLSGNKRGCSSEINKVYYDPTVTYDPPVKADGTPLNDGLSGRPAPTSFTQAWINGFNTAAGSVNLATSYRVSWGSYGSYASCGTGSTTGKPAFYYTYNGSGSTGSDTNYTLVQHNNPTAWTAAQQLNFANWYSYYRNRNSTAKTSVGRAFARFPTNVRVAAQHLNGTGGTTGSSNSLFTTTIAGTNTTASVGAPAGAIAPFSGNARTDFYKRLYNSPDDQGTPLIPAQQRVNTFFGPTNNGANSPYRVVPGTSSSPELSCRQNFHIMMTDGYWNTSIGTAVGNLDGTNRTLGDGTAFSNPTPPYSDTYSSTLADNAFNAWYQDLRTDLTDNVPTHYTDTSGSATQNYWNPVNDPANWQHVVTFTIGLGIDGTLPHDTATYNSLVAGTTNWPNEQTGSPNSDGPYRVDDLWHAALNSRGQYFSAGNPTALSSAFTTIVNNVVDRISSASSVALNAGSLSTNSYVYQSRFNSGTWTGQLLAYPISASTGAVSSTPAWDSGQVLNTQNYDTGRQIITYKPSNHTGIPFRWPATPAAPGASELDTSQTTALNYSTVTAAADGQGQARLDYIRGDASNEGSGNGYRVRQRMCGLVSCPAGTNTGVLGDTINSAPLYVSAPPYLYPDSMEAQPYSIFRTTYANRKSIIYLGGNDGMLHGFDASNGRELIGYVPSPVYNNLSGLTATPFTHKYMVDGDTTAADVFINGAWRTILVGGLRHGGQGLYALDITDPGNFLEANAGNLALWEFTDKNDADVGDTFSTPVIAKMHNNKWAVIFGNGYNNSQPDGTASASGHAVLYILFIEMGTDGVWGSSDFVKIDTGVGTTTTPNGLATPSAVDLDHDNLIDYIYAGDLQGNMWKFDVTNATATNWTLAGNRSVIFTARDSANNPQPITDRPEIGVAPASLPGVIVYFGTGKYLETSDANTAGATTQTFYGIWDSSGVASPTRSDLLQQSVLGEQTPSGATTSYRLTSNNTMVWKYGAVPPTPSYVGWYIDLPTTGERVVSNPILRDDRIIFTTVIPSNDPCSAGGDGWLMELNASNGGRLDQSPFDVNGDGVIDVNDLLNAGGGTTAATGGQKLTGIPASPAILVGGNPSAPGGAGGNCGKECKFVSSSDGSIKQVIETPDRCNYCRASWWQIR